MFFSREFDEIECAVYLMFSARVVRHGEEGFFGDPFTCRGTVDGLSFLPVDDDEAAVWSEVVKTRVEKGVGIVEFVEDGD